jgi:hypothetical protein
MSIMPIVRNQPDITKFNQKAKLPFELRLKDFELAIQDVYDFFYDVNVLLSSKGLQRLDDMLRPAIMSGLLSDMISASLAENTRTKPIFQWPSRFIGTGPLPKRWRKGRFRWS